MIRDHKFQRTEWTLRKKRRVNRRVLVRAFALLAAAGIGYALFAQLGHRLAKPTQSPETSSSSHVIPLKLPPSRPGTPDLPAEK
ncbi:hypothetical protein [Thiocystis violacea]|uniref:hypothetical protein n=1 Tax=Thiocystis violacea TaxID=13725 RepID=UPI0019070717|nr:hypothetical protein [Thiocystis violacea]MBK1719009.1 hypothetical protein [Thiocystis violacea]